MAIIYQFPFMPENDVSEEQRRIWDEEIQAIIDEADRKTELMMDYIYEPPSDNPFEQMARKRAYDEFYQKRPIEYKKPKIPKIVICDDKGSQM